MGKKIRLEPQKIYAIVIVYMLSFMALLNLVNSILNMVGMQTVLDTVALYGILYILVALGVVMFLWDKHRMPLDVLVVVCAFILLYASSYLLHPQNRQHMMTSLADYADNPLYLTFLYSMPCYIFVRKLRDYAYFKQVLVIFSYLIVAMSIIVFFFGGDIHGKQYMTFSYNMMLQLFVLFYHKPQKHKAWHVAFLVIGLFVFAVGGARGALVSFVLAIVFYNILSMRLSKKAVAQLIVAVAAVLVYVIFKEEIISLFTDILKMFSIESRTFEYLIQGIFLDDSNRMAIYEESIRHIGWIGLGMRGDRVFLNGGYVHNLFIELWVDFGWILGTVVIVLLVAAMIGGMKNKHKPEHFFVLMLLANGLLGLMVTGSYLNHSPAFFAFFAFCANAVFRKAAPDEERLTAA